MTLRLEKLTSEWGKVVIDDGSKQAVFHVSNPHALLQAAGYLKHVLGMEQPCSVLFRGQSQLHSTLTPGLYRGVQSQEAKAARDAALKDYLSQLKSEGRVLGAIGDHIKEPLLQHYGIKTRWLDLVDNVWVALWFACHEAFAIGTLGEYLHFERRAPRHMADYAYLLFLRSDACERVRDAFGVWRGGDTELVDLRVAAPSHFLRPHAQHAVLVRKRTVSDYRQIDYSGLLVGVVRVLLVDALGWLGDGSLLSTHSLFPPAQYDFGYRELLQGAASGNAHVGAIQHVGA